MIEAIDAITQKFSGSVPRPDKEYLGMDGLLHCCTCGKAVEVMVKHPFTDDMRKVRCICYCKEQEINAAKERERQAEQEKKRRVCFAETNMAVWNFNNDDRKNEKLSDAMKNYVNKFTEFKKDGKGVLLYGPVGTGKTFLAACVANALLDNGYSVLMTNFASLTNTIQGMYEGKQEYINGLNDYDLLIIDDLGTERKSEYMQEMVFNIIDSRYRAGLPMIITSNLTADELKKPQEVAYSRIYDRVLERCHPVKVDGTSRRRESLKDSFEATQQMLGL